MLADRSGDQLLIALSTRGTGVSALVLAAAPTFWLFAAGAVCLGGVARFHYSVGTALLTRIYDDTGTAIWFHNVGAPHAGLAAPVVVSWVAVRYGWRPAGALRPDDPVRKRRPVRAPRRRLSRRIRQI